VRACAGERPHTCRYDVMTPGSATSTLSRSGDHLPSLFGLLKRVIEGRSPVRLSLVLRQGFGDRRRRRHRVG